MLVDVDHNDSDDRLAIILLAFQARSVHHGRWVLGSGKWKNETLKLLKPPNCSSGCERKPGTTSGRQRCPCQDSVGRQDAKTAGRHRSTILVLMMMMMMMTMFSTSLYVFAVNWLFVIYIYIYYTVTVYLYKVLSICTWSLVFVLQLSPVTSKSITVAMVKKKYIIRSYCQLFR